MQILNTPILRRSALLLSATLSLTALVKLCTAFYWHTLDSGDFVAVFLLQIAPLWTLVIASTNKSQTSTLYAFEWFFTRFAVYGFLFSFLCIAPSTYKICSNTVFWGLLTCFASVCFFSTFFSFQLLYHQRWALANSYIKPASIELNFTNQWLQRILETAANASIILVLLLLARRLATSRLGETFDEALIPLFLLVVLCILVIAHWQAKKQKNKTPKDLLLHVYFTFIPLTLVPHLLQALV